MKNPDPHRVCPVWRSGPRRKRWSLAVVFDFNWNIIISQPGEDGWDVRNFFPNKVQILSAHSLRIFRALKNSKKAPFF